MNYWPLAGVALVIVGFVARLNPLLVVVGAGLATGLLAGIAPLELLRVLGVGFLNSRFLMLFVLTLPVVGLCERAGLRERAGAWVERLRSATASRLLIAYLALRQVAAMFGLIELAGHAQTVRPLLAPMVEAAAEKTHGEITDVQRQQLRALSAATDNIGRFFGEDVFLAFGAVLLIRGFLSANGIDLEPLSIALWGLPTAVAAFAIHAIRLHRLERRLERDPSRTIEREVGK